MHLVAARFRTVAAASAALGAIRSNVAVAPGDSGIRPLGTTRYDQPNRDFLLAGRFADDDVAKVVEIVTAEGGRVIERREELATSAAAAGVSTGPQARTASNPPLSASWMPRPSRPQTGRLRSHPARRPRRPAAPFRVRAARAHRSR